MSMKSDCVKKGGTSFTSFLVITWFFNNIFLKSFNNFNFCGKLYKYFNEHNGQGGK